MGITSGSTVTTDHNRRIGRSVLTVSHASGMAMAAETAVTVTISRAVLARVWAVCARNSRSQASPLAPALRISR